MKTALPSRGLSGVEKSPDSRAWTKSMAESGSTSQGGSTVQAPTSPQPPQPRPALHRPSQIMGQQLDTGHGKGLGKGVESRAPGDLPGSDVGEHEAQLVQ